MITPTRWQLITWLVRHTRGLLAPLGVATLARILGTLTWVAILVMSGTAIAGARSGHPEPLLQLGLTLAALSLVKAGLRYLEHYAGHWVAFAALQRLREVLFSRLIPQAPATTTGAASARLAETATRDIDRIEVFFAHTVPPVVAAVTAPAIALTWLALTLNPFLASLSAGFLGVALLLPFVSARFTWAASRAELAARGAVATHVGDDVQGLREVLAFEAQPIRLNQLALLETQVGRTQRRVTGTRALRAAIERLLWAGALVALLVSGQPTGDVIVAVALLIGLWLGSAGTDDFATGLDSALAATARVRRLAESPVLVPDSGTHALPGHGPLAVELREVSFGYPGAHSPAVAGIDLRVEPGSWHYLVGASGSGKSTIAALISRAWDTDAGAIRLDHRDVRDLTLGSLRGALSVVDQRPMLFPGTVAENLRLGHPGADDARLRWALHIAYLEGDQLPAGLATRVLERGTTLSGGQLQRVALARALVTRPRLLILDESLSQLDATSTARIRERLAEHVRATLIEITHRVDTIDNDATVTVIDGGIVVEQGAAGALRARGGAFTRLSLR